MKIFPNRIAIIGLGLIGGSIALGLKQHFGAKIKIFGSCNTPARSKKAQDEGIIDEIFDTEKPQPEINFFIIATPILAIPQIFKVLSRKIKKQALIMDVASTKEFITRTATKLLPKHISFIGTHPMAGSDTAGFENADPNLFRNKPWIVCDNQSTVVIRLINLLGAKLMFMDSKKHDELVSWASHLNLVSTSLLINTIAKQNNWKEIAQIASTGFRDTTRLASSDVEVKKDIILTNTENIIDALTNLRAEIDLFIDLIRGNNISKIINYFSTAKTARDNWLANYFS